MFDVTAVLGRKRLRPEDVSVSVIDLTPPGPARAAHHLQDRARYPASVIKLFLLVAAHERGLADTLRKPLARMIRVSSNKAMHEVFDALTETRSGPALGGKALVGHLERRQSVDRWLRQELGLTGVRAVNKTWWADDPSPRDRQARRTLGRNKLTTAAAARLLHMIHAGRFGGAEGRDALLDALERTARTAGGDADDRQNNLIGAALPKGAKLFNKSGWTSKTCHDAAIVDLPDGRRFALAIFTSPRGKKGTDCGPLRKLAGAILRGL